MKRIWTTMLFLCMLLSCARAQIMYIDADDANRVHLREEPSMASKSCGLYFSGTPVETGRSDSGFTAVRIGTESGFIKSEYLKDDPAGIDSALRVGTMKNSVSYVNLRRNTGYSELIGDVDRGDTVTVMGETANGWYYVKHGNMTGYMKSNLVRLGGIAAGESALREKLVFTVQGEEITAELHEIGGGEYEREYRVCFLRDGKEISAADFTGDTYAHLRHYESDGGSEVVHVTDVNMDGYADVSIIRYTGATDAEAAHFLYDPQSGGYERDAALDTLSWWRCELYPQTKRMLNYIRDGAVCGTWELYQWEGMEHELLATGHISDSAAAQTLTARVFRENEVVYEANWDERGDDVGEWQRQVQAMLEVMWDGVQPGEAAALADMQMTKTGEDGNG